MNECVPPAALPRSFPRLSPAASWVIHEAFVRDRRTMLHEDHVARFATSAQNDARRPMVDATLRALASSTLLSGLLLLSRP